MKKQVKAAGWWHIWRYPPGLGLLSGIGLLAALVGNAWADALSRASLGLPLAVMGWFGFPCKSLR